MRKKRKNKKKKYILIIVIVCFIVFGAYLGKYIYNKNNLERQELHQKEIVDSYNKFVLTNKDCLLYNENEENIGSISSGVYLVLDDISENYSSEYFKLKFSDMYIKYTDIDKTEEVETNIRYKNYIPFNKSVILSKNAKLYVDDDSYYILDEKLELPVIIDDDDRYYVEFDNKLLYVYKEDCSVEDNINSTDDIASSIAVLNYHFVINKDAGEDKLCEPSSICHTDTQFDSHIKYIKDNGYFSITMEELERFIDGKINLPVKSVAITIDDGWFVARANNILNNYQVMGTLFLIGYLAPVSDYASPYLEVHSHTWNLHNVSECSEGRSALLCYDKDTIITDLKKSRESLNNTPYFCYPFYEYNDNAIEALKEAGFTMALTGGNRKVKINEDKYKVPRYVIYNTTSVDKLASIIS